MRVSSLVLSAVVACTTLSACVVEAPSRRHAVAAVGVDEAPVRLDGEHSSRDHGDHDRIHHTAQHGHQEQENYRRAQVSCEHQPLSFGQVQPAAVSITSINLMPGNGAMMPPSP